MSDTPRDADHDSSTTSAGPPTGSPRPRDTGWAASSASNDSEPNDTGWAASSASNDSEPSDTGWAASSASNDSEPNDTGWAASSASNEAEPNDSPPASATTRPSDPQAGDSPQPRDVPDQEQAPAKRRLLSVGDSPKTPEDQQRRRRRWWVAGISIGAAVVVIALCVGGLSIISAVSGIRDRADDAREARALRDQNCLDLERRLNQLVPPGATTTPKARATAIRDENAAVRVYLNDVRDERIQDAWRRIIDARTVYGDLLERLGAPSTAFYLYPKDDTGRPLAEVLADWSPAACAGPIRRMAAPDL
ncbi:hypothetical protein KOI35_04780 [Actinoplanes bogorensis]|uniref:Uncharacterized protein n=1 Tax=Paractinoplanes bogorensis TaxID=1610840 RepID=A0ABS5YH66_9ACTN|nr:hypothetical protein [Actinoplanes bogorensis]MBU2662817.1 hypothetical protein [Actinoplanes bogorensis]